MLRAIGLLLAVTPLWCSVPTLPEVPAPSPTPTPGPTPEPLPVLPVLAVDGGKFTLNGEKVAFRGAVSCCDDPDTEADEGIDDGWPWVNEATLRWLAERGIWWTHARLGPFAEEREGFHGYARTDAGLYDLERIDADYIARAEALTIAAAKLGVYIEWDLVDAWVLKSNVSPWSFGRNINGVALGLNSLRRPPHPVVEAWVRATVRALAKHTNVTFQVSNESFAAGPCESSNLIGKQWAVEMGFGTQAYCTGDWETRLIEVAREEMDALGVRRLIGSNAHLPVGAADYWAYHIERAARAYSGSKPLLVNETGNMSAAEQLDALRDAERRGTYFALWRGELSREKWGRLLADAFGGSIAVGLRREHHGAGKR